MFVGSFLQKNTLYNMVIKFDLLEAHFIYSKFVEVDFYSSSLNKIKIFMILSMLNRTYQVLGSTVKCVHLEFDCLGFVTVRPLCSLTHCPLGDAAVILNPYISNSYRILRIFCEIALRECYKTSAMAMISQHRLR